tara:strand:- start:30240 stop:31616 length:1377 start_codon:yes stop_codon:yes gene_type:complete
MTYIAGNNAFGGVGNLGTVPSTVDLSNDPYRTTMNAGTPGGANGTSKLWLPIWSGEVMYAYDQYRVFEPLVESRTIASGRSMEFPIMGQVAMKPAWFAGEELLGSPQNHTTQTFSINLDARPIASYFELDNIDLMITQWQYRQELARQAGQTLANARDLQIGAYIVRAGLEDILGADPRAGAGWNKSLAGSTLYGSPFSAKLEYLDSAAATDADRADGALALLAAIEDFMVHLQEINASTDGVYCSVTPQTFHDIRALGVARDTGDLGGGAGRPFFGGVADAGGLGAGLRDGMFALQDSLEYMSCRIIKTNHMPNFDATNTGGAGAYDENVIGEARYNLDFTGQQGGANVIMKAGDATKGTTGVKACLWQSKAVASLGLQGMKVDTVEDVRRNTNFTVASMMAGTGVLRPECAALVVGGFDNSGSGAAGTVITRAATKLAFGMTSEYANTGSGTFPYA